MEGSLRVRARCIDLLKHLEPQLVKQRLERLLEGLDSKGEDKEFLERWGYDDEQKAEIKTAMHEVAS